MGICDQEVAGSTVLEDNCWNGDGASSKFWIS